MPNSIAYTQNYTSILVADAYQRRCAITGERTMPVLQAAHIRSFGQEGPNAVNNGILLRSDMHALFDAGYITIDDDLRVVVSKRLHDDYGNGKDYYPLPRQEALGRAREGQPPPREGVPGLAPRARVL